HNQEHGIEPMSIMKAVRDLTDQVAAARAVAEPEGTYQALTPVQLPKDELSRLIRELEKQMRSAAEALEFEKAAALRDQVFELRGALAEKEDLPPWRRARALAGDPRASEV
ncbi:MAG TPA: UvrB/UvrC motif-containing protein, partial [Anaerolineales bacterium]|nr:UvrB/UvrC motif-containing protein [Anaerolineales bacterium]